MATVRKRRWTYKGVQKEAWVVEYVDMAGKRRLVTERTKRDADRKRFEIEAGIEAGTHTAVNESVKIAAAVDAFLRDCDRRRKIGDMTGNGYAGYEYRLMKHAVPKFGGLRVSELTAEQVQDFVDELRLKYAPATVCGAHQALYAMLQFAVRKRWVKRNVLKDIPTRLPKKTKRTAIPSKGDLMALLTASANIERGEGLRTFLNRQLVVALGIFAGLRPGEMFGLQWENIDFERGIIEVRHSFSKRDGLKAPKTLAGVRDVPLTEPIRAALSYVARYYMLREIAEAPHYRSNDAKAVSARLNRFWEEMPIEVTFEGRTGHVLLSKGKSPMRAEAIVPFWGKLMRDAGLIDPETGKNLFTLHALRHAAVSLLIEAGLPPMNVSSIIGHKSISTTFDVYGHLFPEDTRNRDAMVEVSSRLMQSAPTRSAQLTVRH